MNWREKIGKLIFLERRLQDKSVEEKITQFKSVFMEKLKSKIKRENLFSKREKMNKFNKIRLIY